MRARALAFAYRFSSGVRVSWASSTAFATLGTAVVTLLVLPLLDVLFDVLMGSDLSAPDLVRTGYAAALVALAVSVASGVVCTVATDRMLGVFQEVHTRRRLDVAYWLSVAVVPALLAASTATVAIGVVFALSPLHDVGVLGRVITLAAPTIVCGLLMGIMAAGVGVNLPDPYLGATIIATFLPLLTGVISYIMGEDVTLVSSADETAKDVYRELLTGGLETPVLNSQFEHEFLATGQSET